MGDDGVLTRLAQWVFAKAWLGCVFSGVYAAGGHFGWPRGVLTAAAVLAAVALAVTVAWLPGWTHERPTGIRVADLGARVLVWTGLAAAVAGLLLGSPAVGAVAGALLLDTARRTFAPGWDPLRAMRPRPLPPRSRPLTPQSRPPAPPRPAPPPPAAAPPTPAAPPTTPPPPAAPPTTPSPAAAPPPAVARAAGSRARKASPPGHLGSRPRSVVRKAS